MGIKYNSKINEYIDNICSYVKFKGAHKEIKEELLSHIEDIVDENNERGLSEVESTSEAIKRMGDGEAIGKQLNIAHKGTPDWITLLLTIILVNAGVVLMYLIQYKNSYNTSDYLFNHSLLYSAIGTVGVVLLYFFDYRKLEKYSKYIFIGMCLSSILIFFIGHTIYRSLFISIGAFSVDIKAISLYVFVISLAGIFNNYNWNKGINLFKAIGYLFIPIFLMLSYQGLAYCGIYFITFLVLALKSGMKKRYAFYIVAFNIISFLFYSFSRPYTLKRLLVFLHPFSDPKNSGFLSVQMYNINHTAGILGHGFSSNGNMLNLPSVESEFVFSFILHTFGWLGAAVIISIIISFIYRILHISKYVRDSYGRLLISGLISVFIVQFVSNILMNLNLFPIVGVALPFLSYGGSLGLINMLSVGVIMSVYRRRSLSA
ncbi:FtsW/RodA/SpoVE family cell cycle protein [Clostridium estertheticum]|uniref:FtsW/RodA/SpoVE family cell cycle protein n=1 Tax=Clostridium estertheticum TaxID=238834 RepID=A0A7Y3WSS9_9CLOT|nr:FtsW/RodA/SpoVE family cell cycle protein [Clostridium estertheticum]MBW9171388.1 FtsW/RodA/SpoVE family cell cycle protein [Clostridium estertheticum]NNU77442.1 FtsW/RodA/SpoVE family cell cycle protein [Clostridium estertheticum]WBL48609.1 FtsW/RodA/SpoVE family cell cycle protein [Clostridium estertheticum]WLC76697.1 FtsW/RodA/SpoVE family cell cycle protein [Clostridium estertheticum]